MTPFALAAGLLDAAIEDGAFPAAVIEVGGCQAMHWRYAAGALTYDADATRTTVDTVFDLASLTKVIATTTLVMRAVNEGRVSLDDSVARWIPEWRGSDRDKVNVADLLGHAAGLTAYLPFYRDCRGRAEMQHAICDVPLEYAPRTRSLYSDLGFMLLGFILEDAGVVRSGDTASVHGCGRMQLEAQFREVALGLDVGDATPRRVHSAEHPTYQRQLPSEAEARGDVLRFNPPRDWRARTAPTEVDSWRGRLLIGEVHDENAWVLGGVAGHAGLFGTAGAVGGFARAVLRTLGGSPVLAKPETMQHFASQTKVPGSSRALGWDAMRPTSSCGTRMSPTAIGHTGFTGTSLWIDWERDLYIVLLTNRVYPTRENTKIQQARRSLHDAVVKAFDRSAG